MKRIVRWLETKLSRGEAVADEPSNAEVVKPDVCESTIDIFLGDEVTNLTQDQEPEKNVLMPDVDVDEHIDTVPNLEVLDPSSPDIDESTGFNPYDTAKMHKK